MSSWFEGQRVVCIDNQPGTLFPGVASKLDVGAIYTIREIYTPDSQPGLVGFLLEETFSYAHGEADGFEIGFRETRFRPVRPTSIESLRAILTSPDVLNATPALHDV